MAAGRRREMMADDERVPLDISQEKLCYLIVKAREYDATMPAGNDDSGSNPADDREVSILEEGADNVTLEELRAALDDLDDDEKIAVLALVWLGRGDFEAEEWAAALEEAAKVHDSRETEYLVGIPQLGDLMEEGMAKLGYSCEDFEIGRL